MSVSAQRRAGAPDAEAIWQEFHDRLLGFIQRRVQSRETAEDILQEVMLRIHRHVDGIERAEAVGPWVYAIARNAIADHYRSGIVRRELPAGGEIDPEFVDDSDAEDPGVRAELAACIAPLLKRLPAIYRDALDQTELRGLTQAEAATRVGLSASGMKSRVQRARVLLRRVLVQCCELGFDARGTISGYRQRHGSCDCRGDCEPAERP